MRNDALSPTHCSGTTHSTPVTMGREEHTKSVAVEVYAAVVVTATAPLPLDESDVSYVLFGALLDVMLTKKCALKEMKHGVVHVAVYAAVTVTSVHGFPPMVTERSVASEKLVPMMVSWLVPSTWHGVRAPQ